MRVNSVSGLAVCPNFDSTRQHSVEISGVVFPHAHLANTAAADLLLFKSQAKQPAAHPHRRRGAHWKSRSQFKTRSFASEATMLERPPARPRGCPLIYNTSHHPAIHPPTPHASSVSAMFRIFFPYLPPQFLCCCPLFPVSHGVQLWALLQTSQSTRRSTAHQNGNKDRRCHDNCPRNHDQLANTADNGFGQLPTHIT